MRASSKKLNTVFCWISAPDGILSTLLVGERWWISGPWERGRFEGRSELKGLPAMAFLAPLTITKYFTGPPPIVNMRSLQCPGLAMK